MDFATLFLDIKKSAFLFIYLTFIKLSIEKALDGSKWDIFILINQTYKIILKVKKNNAL